jgi:hypothetical protein
VVGGEEDREKLDPRRLFLEAVGLEAETVDPRRLLDLEPRFSRSGRPDTEEGVRETLDRRSAKEGGWRVDPPAGPLEAGLREACAKEGEPEDWELRRR